MAENFLEGQPIERQAGVAVWRQIADRLERAIGDGRYATGETLPGEIALAAEFGVNRHTVRAAIASLVERGVLTRARGRGTLVASHRRFRYPIGPRTRFSEGLAEQAAHRTGRLLASAVEPARGDVAEALGLADGQEVLRLETISEADGEAVSRSTAHFDSARFPRLAAAYRETGSITAALRIFGIDDYFRQWTAVSATEATAADRADLKLAPGAIVLVTRALNIDPDGRPLEYALTRFPADRVELLVQSASTVGEDATGLKTT